ncbi:unnamed protein product, partial [Brenthis ino]
MAPPPEYDKEPKAPDKSIANISIDDSKVLYNHIKDHTTNPDHKAVTASANEVENNKHVETLDDGQLRALLDEAITYKCPKDREGKSILFKNLLQEVEQDEQACEAAARELGAGRGGRRGRGRREHHSSLQDLVAAMAGEAVPRRGRAHAAHAAPPAASVSARALHGGSLPSGVDTSFLLSEEAGAAGGAGAGAARGGYLATVRCVNPPPLAERRVSAGDAAPEPAANHALADDAPARRSKPVFPMTYTARATLEIGSGSVCSGRAVTTTTASNQVRTPHSPPRAVRPAPSPQARLLRALRGGDPRGPAPAAPAARADALWAESVAAWYSTLGRYDPVDRIKHNSSVAHSNLQSKSTNKSQTDKQLHVDRQNLSKNKNDTNSASSAQHRTLNINKQFKDSFYKDISSNVHKAKCDNIGNGGNVFDDNESDISLRKEYRERVGHDLVAPSISTINPKNFRSMTIGKPLYLPTQESNTKKKSQKKKRKEFQVEIDGNRSVVCKDIKTQDSDDIATNSLQYSNESEFPKTQVGKQTNIEIEMSEMVSKRPETETHSSIEMTEMISKYPKQISNNTDIELVDISYNTIPDTYHSFSEFVSNQHKLMEIIEINNNNDISAQNQVNIESQFKEIAEVDDKNVNIDESSVMDVDNKISKDVALSITKEDVQKPNEQFVITELPDNAYIFLTLPKSFLTAACNKNEQTVKIKEIANNNTNDVDANKNTNKKSKKKQNQVTSNTANSNMNKSALKMLLYRDSDKYKSVKKKSIEDLEVDSAIPFSCITTPEVVASCNTTSSTSQSTVAVDPKPRSVISSNFNGLPLSRPGYASTTSSNTDEYKKSLDENGNAVQGFSSPLSGSSQHKKPRRKKSSKNETVITSHQIDGYQGNKDLNEVLRFIESHADGARAPKLRAKHHDCDDKAGKKRSTERRKDKEPKLKRATSLEELSRTTLEDLTDERRPAPAPARAGAAPAPPKPERRSWGDDARTLLYRPPASAPTPAPADAAPQELTDFQTVTKKRKPRRRADDADRDPATRRARATSPEPRRAPPPSAPPSAPASDRSNDSNDDMDSVHSLPATATTIPPALAAPPAPLRRPRRRRPRRRTPLPAGGGGGGGAGAGDAEQYPALEARRKPAVARPERARKERDARAPEPAPDVVADRRPPVILLDSAARPRDMDGVTFGFDINEQLLGGPRRARCDLLRDAEPAAPGAPPAALPVRAGCGAALRYVPPDAPPDTAHLHQIIDYVGAAWDDVVRCGGGKVRYFSE